MIYMIPIVGWFFGLFFHTSLAIPFWICWNALAPYYFTFIPNNYQYIEFWDTVGLFIIISILKVLIYPKFYQSDFSSKKSK